jgi:hypothetical protein
MRYQIPACALVVVALVTSSVPVRAAGDDTRTNYQAAPGGIRASAERAAAVVAVQPAASLVSKIPLSLPRQSGVKKGMGTGMMIVSLVGTAAGIAGTYYMVKTIKDQTKTVPGS